MRPPVKRIQTPSPVHRTPSTKKTADYHHWQKTFKINAREAFEHAKVTAARTRTRAIADAQRTLDEAEANAMRQHDLAIAAATTSRWQADVTARQTVLQVWHLAQQTPWSAYQLALVNNEAQYVSLRASAYTPLLSDFLPLAPPTAFAIPKYPANSDFLRRRPKTALAYARNIRYYTIARNPGVSSQKSQGGDRWVPLLPHLAF